MLTLKNRLMATAALLAIAAPSLLLTPAAEAAAVSNVVVKQSVADNLIADRYDYNYGGNYRQPIFYGGGHRRHHNRNYRYSNFYQPPVVIYNKPVGIYHPPQQVIHEPHHVQRCVRTLYATICN
jgi:hypothetical protein